jgi:hypothetical protein
VDEGIPQAQYRIEGAIDIRAHLTKASQSIIYSDAGFKGILPHLPQHPNARFSTNNLEAFPRKRDAMLSCATGRLQHAFGLNLPQPLTDKRQLICKSSLPIDKKIVISAEIVKQRNGSGHNSLLNRYNKYAGLVGMIPRQTQGRDRLFFSNV